nr:MAG TPA: hypothetical protein [Caudoviricetes sp.]
MCLSEKFSNSLENSLILFLLGIGRISIFRFLFNTLFIYYFLFVTQHVLPSLIQL